MMLTMQATAAITAINLVLLAAILWTNVCCYKDLKSQYTLSLLLFAGLFFAENLLRGWFLFTKMDFYAPEVVTPMLFLAGLQTAAFALLLWLQRQ